MIDVKLTAKGKTAKIVRPEILDFGAAGSLKVALEQALAGGQPFKLDAKNVERLSTPCIQLLIAAERAMKDAEMSFALAQPADAFIDTFNDLGVFSHLKQWTIEGYRKNPDRRRFPRHAENAGLHAPERRVRGPAGGERPARPGCPRQERGRHHHHRHQHAGDGWDHLHRAAA